MVMMSAVGAAAMVGLGTLFFVTWWRRRYCVTAASGVDTTELQPEPPTRDLNGI
jgi:hypothetical protein